MQPAVQARFDVVRTFEATTTNEGSCIIVGPDHSLVFHNTIVVSVYNKNLRNGYPLQLQIRLCPNCCRSDKLIYSVSSPMPTSDKHPCCCPSGHAITLSL